MKQHVTDAEIVAFLGVLREHDGVCERASSAAGIPDPTARRWVKEAARRGLTADTPVISEEEKLRIALRRAQADVRALQREADTAEAIRREIYDLASRTPEPPVWLIRDGVSGNRGTPMTLWSDWHFGEVVRPEEVGGMNQFDAEIAKVRARRLVERIISLSYDHMGRAESAYPGIVVCLGGDMISGDIHEELMATNDRTPQQCINDLTDILAGALETLADKFGNVFVPCVVGNHGRATRKPRMKGRVYTSHEWNIYCNLERHFRRDDRVQFMIPNESDAYFKVYDHRFLLTHGDSLGVKGGDGIIGAIGPIMRGSIKVGRSEVEIGRQVDTILMGHWHQLLWLPGVIVNNCLKGYDEFARLALRAPYSRPSQALWFVHPEHGTTARWEVFLEGRQNAKKGAEWVSWPRRV